MKDSIENLGLTDNYMKCKQLTISLANLLYKIEMDDKDCKVLAKSISANKEFLKTLDLKKSDVSKSEIIKARKFLERKYN